MSLKLQRNAAMSRQILLMQLALSVNVLPISGGFVISELNNYLSQGYTVNNAYASTDNALLVILDEPKKETQDFEDR